ncbi:restriction endonuclease subunit S [Actinomadura terrae]|uniref:restriction endonuclease subunit S n=1 Tax=Actinomadura terrae TaxID=604353 RepID=UPI001FA75027|nr:restriction endonuclease subunit S [Actinomadura terrae]
MNDLPPGWAEASLGEIADTSLGKMLDRGKATGKHTVPYLRNVNVQWGRIDLDDVLTMEIPPEEQDFFKLEPRDLLVCEGGEVGRCAIWAGDAEYMAFQKALHRVRPHAGIEVKYLRYLMEYMSLSRMLVPYSTGSTIKHLSQQQLRRLPIVIPPTPEQCRIVAALEGLLSRLERGTEQVAKLIRRIDRFRDALMAAACTGRLKGDSYYDFAAVKLASADSIDGDLPDIPSHWSWARLSEIAEVVGGVTKDSKKQSDPALPEVPYLRVANVQRGRLDLANVSYIRVPPQKARQLELRPGDVLLNEGGDRDKLGRGWIWEGQIPGCIHQNHVFRARVLDSVLHPKLLAWHANGFGKRWCEVNGKQSVNLASISLAKIKMLPLPLPPIEEQKQLVAEAEQYLTLLDNAERTARASLSRAYELRKSLLTEAFAGRLVEQDPADEPASVLLERIRAERVVQGPVRRTRRGKGEKAPQKETLL